MVAMTSSTVHCRLIRPNVANRGPPCIIQVGVIMAMRSSMLCGVARGQVVSREDRWCRARTGGVARGQVVSREDRWCRARTGGVARGQVDLTARKLTGTHSGYGGWARGPVRGRGGGVGAGPPVGGRVVRCHGGGGGLGGGRGVGAGGLL